MDAPILSARRELLRHTQNSDGGWGYFAGKQSWMEPTAYAMLALEGDPASVEPLERAWKLVLGWQTADGGWQPSGQVAGATWITALGVTLCISRQEYGAPFEKGVGWLLKMCGQENGWLSRVLSWLPNSEPPGRDITKRGWPWRPDTSSWVEPTVHSLMALKKAAPHFRGRELKKRVAEAEDLLLSVRGSDGGWNYGSARALGVELPSYPETTALAWLGLQNRLPYTEFTPANVARNESRLAGVWSAIARSVAGKDPDIDIPLTPPPDLMIAALEALAAPGGNAAAFRTETPV